MSDTCKICGKELKRLTLNHLISDHDIQNWKDYDNYKVSVKPAVASTKPVVESAPVGPPARPQRSIRRTQAVRPNWTK